MQTSRVLPTPGSWSPIDTVLVPGGARLSGAVATAMVVVDAVEHARRSAWGLGAITSLPLLDALMCLPQGVPVAVADVSTETAAVLRAGPDGCAEWLPGDAPTVRRLVAPAADVSMVVVESGRWADALGRAAVFAPVAPRVVLIERGRVVESRLWEADAAGVGVWARDPDGTVAEVVAPAPFVRRYFKPAGWRFRERAYGAWLTPMRL